MLQSEEDYQAMLDHVNTVYESLEFSIDAVADEMDEKFRQNNSLTVDYQIQHLSTDIEANTATFQLYAIPKTFVPGMTAVFQARSRENVVELTAESDEEGAFSGTLTCPLSDDISLFVTFVTGETRSPDPAVGGVRHFVYRYLPHLYLFAKLYLRLLTGRGGRCAFPI